MDVSQADQLLHRIQPGGREGDYVQEDGHLL